MRWCLLLLIIILIPTSDRLAFSVGLIIVSAAITYQRGRRYIEDRMKDSIDNVVQAKAPIAMAIGGGAVTFTATNIISVFGLIVGVIGVVIGVLQWRESKRRNDLMQRDVELKERQEVRSIGDTECP